MAKDGNVANNTSEQTDQGNLIGVAEEHKLVFPTLRHTMVTSSIELDGTFAQIFKSAYDDFTGFRPCRDRQTGRFYLTACFEQKQYPENASTAFEFGVKQKESTGFERIQSLYRMTTEGNRFHLTDEAKKEIGRFVGIEGRDRNKDVLWNSAEVVSQLGDPQTSFGMPSKTYNVINYIDPVILLKEVYGTKAKVYVGDENDVPQIETHLVEYEINVLGPLATPQYMEKEMQRFALINQYYQFGQKVPDELMYNMDRYCYDPVKLMVHQVDGKVMETAAASVGYHYRNQLGIDT